MVEKIILITVLVIGALIAYLAKPIASKIKLIKSEDKNIILVKVIGFVIVLITALVAFFRF